MLEIINYLCECDQVIFKILLNMVAFLELYVE